MRRDVSGQPEGVGAVVHRACLARSGRPENRLRRPRVSGSQHRRLADVAIRIGSRQRQSASSRAVRGPRRLSSATAARRTGAARIVQRASTARDASGCFIRLERLDAWPADVRRGSDAAAATSAMRRAGRPASARSPLHGRGLGRQRHQRTARRAPVRRRGQPTVHRAPRPRRHDLGVVPAAATHCKNRPAPRFAPARQRLDAPGASDRARRPESLLEQIERLGPVDEARAPDGGAGDVVVGRTWSGAEHLHRVRRLMTADDVDRGQSDVRRGSSSRRAMTAGTAAGLADAPSDRSAT